MNSLVIDSSVFYHCVQQSVLRSGYFRSREIFMIFSVFSEYYPEQIFLASPTARVYSSHNCVSNWDRVCRRYADIHSPPQAKRTHGTRVSPVRSAQARLVCGLYRPKGDFGLTYSSLCSIRRYCRYEGEIYAFPVSSMLSRQRYGEISALATIQNRETECPASA